jgi:hypothetical protein
MQSYGDLKMTWDRFSFLPSSKWECLMQSKSIVSRSFFLTALTGSLMMNLVAAPSANAATEKKGLIDTETWTAQGNPWVLKGDIKITGTLTLEAGVEVIAESSDETADNLGDSTTEVEIIIEGSLVVNGTEESPVTIDSNNTNQFQGILMTTNGAILDASYFDLSYALVGVNSKKGTVTWDHGSIKHVQHGFHVHSPASIDISELTIRHFSYRGVLSYGTTNISRSSIIDGAGWNGGPRSIEFNDVNSVAASLTCDHCVLGDATYYALVSKEHVSSNFRIVNSIMMNGTYSLNGVNVSFIDVDNNLFYNAPIHASYTNSLNGNPLFAGNLRNPGSTTDFRITANSPARRAMLGTDDATDVLGRYAYDGTPTNEMVGYLYDDVTVASEETLVVVGDLRILPGVTFTVEGGGTVQMEGGDVYYGTVDNTRTEITIEAGGNIVTEQTSEDDRAVFKAATSGVGKWYGLRYLTGTQADLSYMDIKDTYRSIYAYTGTGAINIDHSRFETCEDWAITAHDGRPLNLSHNVFFDSACRVYAEDATHSISYNIADSVYRDNFSITFSDGASHLSFHHNTVRGASSSGYAALYLNQDSPSSTTDIRDNNLIRGHCAYRKGAGTYSAHHSNTWSNTSNFCSGVTNGNNNISQNPLLVDDSEGGDFALTSNSPLRLQASDGTDIGAIPYAGVPTTENPSLFYGTLVEDVTFATGYEYFISGDLVVPEGVTLTFEPGTTVRFGPGDVMASGFDAARTEIIVYGTLIAQGEPGGEIQLLSGNVTTPADNDWYGIRMLAGSTGHKLAHLNIAHARAPLYVDANEPITIEHVTSTKGRNSLVGYTHLTLVGEGPYMVTDNRFQGGYWAVAAGKADTESNSRAEALVINLQNNFFYDYYNHGVLIDVNHQSAQVHVEHNTFFSDYNGNTFSHDHLWFRSLAVDQGATIKNNIFASNQQYQGIDADSSTYKPDAHHNLFYSRWYQNVSGVHFMRNWKGWQDDGTNDRGNPLFVDESTWDFRLTVESPGRMLADDGSDVGAVQFDEANPSAGLVGVIRDHRVLEKQIQPHILLGDVIIAEGASLTIEPGAEVHFQNSDHYQGGLDGERIEITVHGDLAVGGGVDRTVLQGLPSVAGLRTWYGIHVEKNGTLSIFENAEVHHTSIGVYLQAADSFSFDDVSFSDFYNAGMWIKGDQINGGDTTVTVVNSIFEDGGSGAKGIIFEGAESTNPPARTMALGVTFSLFRDLSESGIWAHALGSDDSLLVDHNTFYNSYRGVYYQALEPNNASFITNNLVTKHTSTWYPVHIDGSYHPITTHNLLWRAAHNYNYLTHTYGNDIAAFRADNNIQENPLLADPDNGNYEPTHRSPLRYGDSEGGDIGAYPYTGEQTVDLMGWLHENETLSSPDPIFLSGDLTILPGRVLSIAPGTELQVRDSDPMYANSDYQKAEIIVRGILDARGSTLEPILIRSYDTQSAGIQDWYGIDIREDSPAQTLSYLDVRDSVYGMVVSSAESVEVSHSSFSHHSTIGVWQKEASASLSLSQSKIYNVAGYGLRVNGLDADIRNNVVYQNTGYGVFLNAQSTGGGTVLFANNTIDGNNGGLQVYHGTNDVTHIYNNVMSNSNGWGFYTYHDTGVAPLALPTLLNNNLTGNSSGSNAYGNMTTLDTSNLQVTNLHYVDAANRNYRLLETSDLIDNGRADDIATGELDYDGRPRIAASTIGGLEIPDIGAFEYSIETVLLLGAAPARIPQGDEVTYTVFGQGFDTLNGAIDGGAPADWSLAFSGTGVSVVGDPTIIDDTTMSFTVFVADDATRSLRELVLNDGVKDVTLFSALEVYSGPTIVDLSETSVKQDTTTTIVITGTNFLSGANVSVSGAGVIVTNPLVVSETEVHFTLQTSNTAPVEFRDVTVTNSDGGQVTLPQALEILIKDLPPQLSAVAPSAIQQEETAVLILTGADFIDGLTVDVAGIDLSVNSVEFVSSTTVNIEVQATATAAIIPRNITVTNPDGQFDSLVGALNVTGELSLDSVTPSDLILGQTYIQTTLAGAGFMPGMTFILEGPGGDTISVLAQETYLSSTQYWLYISVDENAPLGGYKLIASAPDGGTAEMASAINITAGDAPLLNFVTPNRLVAGTSFVPVQITGAYLRNTFELEFTTDDLTIESAQFTSSTQIDALLSIAGDAAPGPRDLSISIPLAGSNELISAVNVEEPVSILALTVENGLDPILPIGAAGITFRVVGTNVGQDYDVEFSGGVIGLSTPVIVSDDEITFTGSIDPAAAVGYYDLGLTLNGHQVANASQVLQLIRAPDIVSALPDPVTQGETVLGLALTGVDLPDDSSFRFQGSGISVDSSSWQNIITYHADITIDDAAPIGPHGMEIILGTGYVWPASGTLTVLPKDVSIALVEPNAIPQDAGLVTLSIQGEGFITGGISSFEFLPSSNIGIMGTPTIISDTEATVDINVPSDAVIDTHDLTAYFGIYDVATAAGALEIIPHVAVSSVAPNHLMQGQQSQDLTIFGEGFVNSSTVAFSGGGVEITNLSFVSSTELQIQVDAAQDAPVGVRDIEIIFPSGYVHTEAGVFEVRAGPDVTTVTPYAILFGSVNECVTVVGTSLTEDMEWSFSGDAIDVHTTTWDSSTLVTLCMDVAQVAAPGDRDLILTRASDNLHMVFPYSVNLYDPSQPVPTPPGTGGPGGPIGPNPPGTIDCQGEPPELQLCQQTPLFYVVSQGGATSPHQSIYIDSDPLGAEWIASANQPWVLLDATQGTAQNFLNIAIDPATLLASNSPYSAELTLQKYDSVTGIVSDPTRKLELVIEVTLTPFVGDPRLEVIPSVVELHLYEGEAMNAFPFQVISQDLLSYPFAALVSDPNRIQLSGTTGNTPENMNLFVETSDLVASAIPYQYTFDIIAPDLENSPVTVTARVFIDEEPPPGTLSVVPSQVVLSADEGSTDPVYVSTSVSAYNGTDVGYSTDIPVDATWLSIDTASLHTPEQALLTADPTGLTFANSPYETTVTYTSQIGDIIQVPVLFYIGTEPPVANAGTDLDVAPTVVHLSGYGSGPDPDYLDYDWVQISGPEVVVLNEADTAFPNFVAQTSGSYLFELTVMDENDVSGTPDSVEVVVRNVAPSAFAGVDLVYELSDPSAVLTLYGDRSADGNGEALTYLWEQTSGPTVILSDSTLVNPELTVTQTGRYGFKLTVADDTGSQGSDRVTYIVQTTNDTVPTAIISAPPSASINESILLDGSSSSHSGDGQAISYSWRQVSGPGGELVGAFTSQVTFETSQEGVAVFELIVNDGEHSSIPEQVSIAIGSALNLVPTANAFYSHRLKSLTDVVELDASLSETGTGAPGGDFLTYQWGIQEGIETELTAGTSPISMWYVTPPVIGVYNLSLQVREDGLASIPAQMWLSVYTDTEHMPVASVVEQGEAFRGVATQLQTLDTEDEDGQSLSYRWSQTKGPKVGLSDPTTQSPFFTPQVTGHYAFELRVDDGNHLSPPAILEFEVVDSPNQSPIADAGPDIIGTVGQTIALDGALSWDENEDPLTYTWIQTGGVESVVLTNSDQVLAEFTPTTPGLYRFELVVNDGEYDSSPSEVLVSVNPAQSGVTLTPENLFFVVEAGGLPSPTQTVDVSALMLGADVSFSVSSHQSWLVLDASPASTPGQIHVSVDPAQLINSTNMVYGTIRVDAVGYDFESIPVVVSVLEELTLSDTLEVLPRQFNLAVQEGSGPVSLDVQILALDGDAYSFFIVSDDTDVLTIEAGDSLTPETARIEVDTASLQVQPDPHTFSAHVFSPNLQNSPQEILISVHVEEQSTAGPFVAAPSALVFSSDEGSTDWVGTVLKLDGENNAALTWTAAIPAEASWIHMSPQNGITPSTLSVAADPSGFTEADSPITTVLTFISDADDSIEVPVTFYIGSVVPTAQVVTYQASLPTQITLDGSGSESGDGSNLTYAWTQVGGANVVLSDATSATTRFAGIYAGLYQFELVVTDESGRDSLPVIAEVYIEDVSPIAHAGVNMAFHLETESRVLRLYGNQSRDGNDDELAYQWRQLDGPEVEITGANGADAIFNASEAGVYAFELSVSDATGHADTSKVTYLVDTADDTIPNAHVETVDRGVVNAPFFLDGTGSHHGGDGSELFYLWTQVSGPTGLLEQADAPTAIFTSDEAGVLVMELMVHDGTHASPPARVMISIDGPIDTVPLASFSATDQADNIGFCDLQTLCELLLDAAGSMEGPSNASTDNLVLTFGQSRGAFTQINALNETQVEVLPVLGGVYQFASRARYGDLLSPAYKMTLLVHDANHIPASEADVSENLRVGLPVELTALTTMDEDGDMLEYRWTQTSGPWVGLDDPILGTVSFTPRVAGDYTFALRADDGLALGPASNISFTVEENPNQGPIAHAGEDQEGFTDNAISLDGSLSEDADGDLLTYAWSQKEGPVTVAISDADTVNPSFVGYFPGTYAFELIVNDGQESSQPDEVAVVLTREDGMVGNNTPPSAYVAAQIDGSVGAEITLDGSGSFDPDGDELTYTWAVIDSPENVTLLDSDTAMARFTPGVQGIFYFSLQVSDGELVSPTVETSVFASAHATNDAPVANAGEDQELQRAEETKLDGSQSSDADDDTLIYRWTQLTGPVLLEGLDFEQAVVPLTLMHSGPYQFELWVSDGLAESTDQVVLEVVSGPSSVDADAGTGGPGDRDGGTGGSVDGGGGIDDGGCACDNGDRDGSVPLLQGLASLMLFGWLRRRRKVAS